jgi:hypothetical protein
MKKIIVYLISLLLFIFTNPSLYSADITEFQIDNAGINESLLNYFSEEEIKKETFFYKTQKNNKDFGHVSIKKKIKGSIYDEIIVAYNSSDKKYLIKHIAGSIKFENNNIKECLKKKEEITKEVSVIFKDNKTFDWGKKPYSFDRNSYTYQFVIYFGDTNIYPNDSASITCYEWSKQHLNYFQLSVSIFSKEYNDYLYYLKNKKQ